MHYFSLGTPRTLEGIKEKTAKNKGFDVLFGINKINITFSESVIVENIIPRNVIINRGHCTSEIT